LRAQYEARLRQGQKPLIIDCGANIGLASLWFAHAFPQAHIVAVEPDGANFALLQRNIAPYGGRITALRGGIWSVEDHLRIDNPSAGSAAFRVVPCSADHPDAVRTFTIPGISADHGVERPLIVKVDIEGAQGPLFSAHADWVGASDLIVLELDDWQLPWTGTSRPFFAAVSSWPFDFLLGGESIFCFRDYAADPAPNGAQAG
jgi:FkbM family methyltransferase